MAETVKVPKRPAYLGPALCTCNSYSGRCRTCAEISAAEDARDGLFEVEGEFEWHEGWATPPGGHC